MSNVPADPAPTTPAEETAPTTSRDAMMRAFSVAETVTAQLPDRPSHVMIHEETDSTYSVEIYFHHAPEQVARFAAQHGVEVTERPEYAGKEAVYTSADIQVSKVAVRCWSLIRLETATASEHAA